MCKDCFRRWYCHCCDVRLHNPDNTAVPEAGEAEAVVHHDGHRYCEKCGYESKHCKICEKCCISDYKEFAKTDDSSNTFSVVCTECFPTICTICTNQEKYIIPLFPDYPYCEQCGKCKEFKCDEMRRVSSDYCENHTECVKCKMLNKNLHPNKNICYIFLSGIVADFQCRK